MARLLLGNLQSHGGRMNGGLVVAILLIATPLGYAQDKQPHAAKLKSDAQTVVSIIKSDKAKTRVYCEINNLGELIGEADERKDAKKAEALSQQVTELEKRLGPEYSALVNDLNKLDLNSPEGQEIETMFAPLDDSCED